MVNVRITETGEELDVVGSITYVKQIDDIGEITKSSSSYSWQLTFPKSPRNTRIFRGLGIAGSTSSIPYDKIICQVLYQGETIEPNGNLIITETKGDNYIGHVKAGLIDFLKDISSDKISDVIDLSSLNHLNTVENIKSSFTDNLPYKYIVAYYNGQKLSDNNGVTNLNPNSLVPSISVKFLWDKIFNHYGWTYSGTFSLIDTWMTYPSGIKYSEKDTIIFLDASFNRERYYYDSRYGSSAYLLNPNTTIYDTEFVKKVSPFDYFEIQKTGKYLLKAKVKGNSYSTRMKRGLLIPLLFRIEASGQVKQAHIIGDGANEYSLIIDAKKGDQVAINIIAGEIKGTFWYNQLISANLTIETLGVQEIDFSSALIKIKVKDFFKEVMVRNALTPFVDVENKAIRFRTLNERLNAPVIDWTSKYITEARSEKYVYNSYAQKNIIKHKYNEENQDFADGVISVDNENQPSETTLYDSFTYAPEEILEQYNGKNSTTYFVQNFRMYNVEVTKESDTNELIANYKQLKDRFYFIKSSQVINDVYILNELATEFSLAEYSEVFADIVDQKYSNLNQLINEAKIITVNLVISLVDVAMLDFYKQYYFEQEKAYFLLNSLTWKEDELAVGEFIKINK
jgi:hypothetical protein